MRILKFHGRDKIGFEDIPKPACDEEMVILKVKASALCGSESGRFRGEPAQREGAYNPGHEVVGVIEEAPADSGYRPGMRVGARVVQGCGACEFCAQGYETACRNRTLYAGNGHAEYFRLGVNGIQPVPDGVAWPPAALLTGDGLGVPVRCARRLGDTKGKRVLVLGLGPVGLSCVLVQAFRGAEVMGAELLVEGTEGRLMLDDLSGSVTRWDDSRESVVYAPAQIRDRIGLAENCVSAVKDFALAVHENRPAPIPGEDGVAMIALEEAVYRSAETGIWEEIVLCR